MELFDYIDVFYNQRRRHSTIGQVSPAAFEKTWATQAKLSTESGQAQVARLLSSGRS